MNLVVDIGNTLLKYGVFEHGLLIAHGSCELSNWYEIKQLSPGFSINQVLVSTVVGVPADLKHHLAGAATTWWLDETTPLPIVNAYTTPQTLGRDRLANACAAAVLFPGEPVLVIDAGTCLKFDFVDAHTTYLGGAISPGLLMRISALHRNTAQLPLVEPVQTPPLIGRDTRGAILSGVVNGMCAEIDGVVQQYIQIAPRLKSVMTGGDAEFFLNQLKSRIFAAPQLTLTGLNAILDFQQV